LSKNKHRTKQQLAKNETEQVKENWSKLEEEATVGRLAPRADPTDDGHRSQKHGKFACGLTDSVQGTGIHQMG